MERKRIKVLFLEDSQDDYKLNVVTLKKYGLEPQGIRVGTKNEFIKQLNKNSWDIIISDYKLPTFNGLEAYELVKKHNLDIPIIIVTGALSEEVARSCIEKGIDNYVMKDDLARLGPATKQTLEKRDLERSRKKTEEKLKEVYKVLYDLNRDLRCRVEESTADLKKSNKLLKQKIIEYKKAEKIIKESEKKYKTLYNSSRDALMILDIEKGLFLAGNPATIKLFGCHNEKGFTSKTPPDLSPKYQHTGIPSSEKIQKMISKSLKNGSHFFEWRYKKIDGTEFDATVLLTKLELDGKTVLQATVRDITDRKQKEKELQRNAEELAIINMELKTSKEQLAKMNKDLEGKIQESHIMNQELGLVKDQLFMLNKNLEKKVQERTVEVKKLLKHKDNFIGQLGHDLKTPLSILLNILPMAEEDIDNPLVKEDLKIAIRNVNYIKKLVIETLSIAELASPDVKLNIVDINLLELINNVSRDNKRFFKSKGVKIEYLIDDDIVIKADELRIREVIANLIYNATNAMPNGGKITIETSKVKEDDFVAISVKDTGFGMTDEQIGHMFEEFYKADEARHDLGSTGLGLSICKRIVEKHGGKIWVKSPGPGKGTTFYFTLLNKKK